MSRLIATAAALAAAVSPAAAEIIARQVVEQEIVRKNPNGSVSLERVEAGKVAPGEEVIYSVRFRNESPEPASDLVMVMPVPDEVSYVEGSTGGAPSRVTFSADGGASYLTRGKLTVRVDGVERPATSDEITHVKWTLTEAVSANGEGEVFYRAVLK